MQKVRQREGEVERQLREIAERQKARQNQEQADRAVVAQQQQRAEQQIADLKKELKKQKDKNKDGQKQSSPGHPLHDALHKRQASDGTIPKTVASDDMLQGSQRKNGSRDDYDRLLDSSHEGSYASPSARDSIDMKKANKFATPLGYGKLTSEGFFAMKQLATNKAKDARPETPFSGGTSIEYALHMNAFDAATDNDALDAKDKLFELTKWFSGPAGRIIKAHNVNNDKEEAYAMARSQLDVFFSQHRDSFAETLKKVKKGKQIEKNDYQSHFELFSELVEAQMALVASNQVQEFDRRDVLRDILESRLEHMADSFWEKDEEKLRTTGSAMKFDDLLVRIQRWMTVLNNKGMAHKKPTTKIAAVASQASSNSTKQTYASRLVNSPPKQQSTERCNICGSIHATEDCNQLVNIDVDARMNLLSSKGLCFHCFEPGHQAKACTNRANISCKICKRKHATLLHDRKYASPSKLSANSLPFRPRAPSTKENGAADAAPNPLMNAAVVNPTI